VAKLSSGAATGAGQCHWASSNLLASEVMHAMHCYRFKKGCHQGPLRVLGVLAYDSSARPGPAAQGCLDVPVGMECHPSCLELRQSCWHHALSWLPKAARLPAAAIMATPSWCSMAYTSLYSAHVHCTQASEASVTELTCVGLQPVSQQLPLGWS